MSVIVLDTDVVSNILRNRLDPRLEAELVGHDLAITYVTHGELIQWAELRAWGPLRRRQLDEFLAGTAVLPGNRSVAVTWGRISALARQSGVQRPINDSWVAACCLTYDRPLATLNVRDFAYYAEAHGLRLITA